MDSLPLHFWVISIDVLICSWNNLGHPVAEAYKFISRFTLGYLSRICLISAVSNKYHHAKYLQNISSTYAGVLYLKILRTNVKKRKPSNQFHWVESARSEQYAQQKNSRLSGAVTARQHPVAEAQGPCTDAPYKCASGG